MTFLKNYFKFLLSNSCISLIQNKNYQQNPEKNESYQQSPEKVKNSGENKR